MPKLILLGLNEINFPFVERYISRGLLPNFARLLELHGYQETRSEDVYEHIEPWIQWVSIHTGVPFAQHKVFRLGDIVDRKLDQIWESLEKEKGIKVGAMTPMNAENRLRNGAFFFPDPWTETPVSGPRILSTLRRPIVQAVRDNAQDRITLASKAVLAAGFLACARRESLLIYAHCFRESFKKRWFKVMFLDRLLADMFVRLWKETRPDFASLFLNAGAHIQHHYLFNSKAYAGPSRNPSWYIPPQEDPVLDVYRLYDRILAEILDIGGTVRVMVATGLHQDPHERVTYYYRLKNHAGFLGRLGIRHQAVHPLMSRDFTVTFHDSSDCRRAENLLKSFTDARGQNVFEVDNRGSSLFASLVYDREIGPPFPIHSPEMSMERFDEEVVFVALKNAHHNGTGYFSDTAVKKMTPHPSFPVWEIRDRILAHF